MSFCAQQSSIDPVDFHMQKSLEVNGETIAF